MGIGEVYALVCAVVWASAVVMYKHVSETMTANTLNLTKNVIGLGLLLPTALLVEQLNIPQLPWQTWLIVAASGYVGIALADTLFIQALRVIGASRTAVVASLYSPFVVLLSILFLGERLNVWQGLGFVMILAGILTVIYQRSKQEVDLPLLIKGAAMAAFSVFLTAGGVVAMKPVLSNDSFFWLVTFRMAAGVLGMLLYISVRGKLVATYCSVFKQSHQWGAIITASVLGAYLAMLLWLAGFKYTSASIASVLNETSSIFIVLMAALFLKEPLTVRKILGVGLAFSGVLVFLGLLN